MINVSGKRIVAVFARKKSECGRISLQINIFDLVQQKRTLTDGELWSTFTSNWTYAVLPVDPEKNVVGL